MTVVSVALAAVVASASMSAQAPAPAQGGRGGGGRPAPPTVVLKVEWRAIPGVTGTRPGVPDQVAVAQGHITDPNVELKEYGAAPKLLKTNGVRVDASYPQLGAVKIEAPLGKLEKLAASGNTRYLSLDRKVQTLGHVTATTGTDLVSKQTTTTTTTTLGVSTTNSSTVTLDGTGIGIAVVDSGVDTGHVAFLDKTGKNRVVFSRDFTGENRVDDPYGHGTHVASIAAGNGRVSNGAYTGIAPNANIVNLRVLNSQGTGTVSATLAALDWLVANRVAYNIRVVNLSLGTPAVDSYKNDPICRAVRRLVDAGVVVVAAAGNNGKNSDTTPQPADWRCAIDLCVHSCGCLHTKLPTETTDINESGHGPRSCCHSHRKPSMLPTIVGRVWPKSISCSLHSPQHFH